MSIEKIKKLEDTIEQVEKDHQAFLRAKEQEIADATKRRDETIAALQAERDALALKIKLAEYPAELVEHHKTCSVCGATMRPFKITKDDKVIKLWACSASSLSPAHDLVTVLE